SPNAHSSSHSLSISTPIRSPCLRSATFPSSRNCVNSKCGAKGMPPCSITRRQYCLAFCVFVSMSPRYGEHTKISGLSGRLLFLRNHMVTFFPRFSVGPFNHGLYVLHALHPPSDAARAVDPHLR